MIDLHGPTDVADLLPPSPHARPFTRRWVPAGPDEQQLARRMSPIAHVRADAPPILIVHGDADDVVPTTTRRASPWRCVRPAVELVTLPGGRHGFLTERELTLVEQRVGAFLVAIGLLSPAS